MNNEDEPTATYEADRYFWPWYAEALKLGWSDDNARRYDSRLAFRAGFVAAQQETEETTREVTKLTARVVEIEGEIEAAITKACEYSGLLEASYGDQCKYCAKRMPTERNADGVWRHVDAPYWDQRCHASVGRERAYKRQLVPF